MLLLLAIASLAATFRAPPVLLRWGQGGTWASAAPNPARPAVPAFESDLDGDGRTERLALSQGRVTLLDQGIGVWSSPPEWDVRGAQTADLTRDGRPEIVLLVWRPFAPWPVDAWLPHGGRIAGFHDAQNRSCHIILIGWAGSEYRELWAGSALAKPIVAFYAADWTGDGRQDLTAVEAEYSRPSQGRGLALWEWNGFGFTLADRWSTDFDAFVFLLDADGAPAFLAGSSGGFGA
ncbi:MAG: VCBS repeat-containing protein [Anaerolineales bacterium]|nr:VCBS repeat-containing protein [Anaerolineales bacterium]